MKSAFLSMFTTDPALEVDGIVARYDDFRVLLARAGGANESFVKAFERYSKPYKHQIENDMLARSTSDEIMAKVLAEAVVKKTWLRRQNEDGTYATNAEGGEVWDEDKMPLPSPDGRTITVVPYTRENMERLLLLRTDWMRDVQQTANRAANYRQQEEERELGNS